MALLEKFFYKIVESASILKCRQQDLFDLARDKKLNLAVQAKNRKVLVLQKQANGGCIAIGECEVSGIFESVFTTALLHAHPLENRFLKSNHFQFQYLYPTSNKLLFDIRLYLKWSEKPNHSTCFLPFDITYLSEGHYLLEDKQTNGAFAESIGWVSVNEDEAVMLLQQPLTNGLFFRLFEMDGNTWFHGDSLGLMSSQLDLRLIPLECKDESKDSPNAPSASSCDVIKKYQVEIGAKGGKKPKSKDDLIFLVNNELTQARGHTAFIKMLRKDYDSFTPYDGIDDCSEIYLDGERMCYTASTGDKDDIAITSLKRYFTSAKKNK